MNVDSTVSIASLFGCALLGLTPSIIGTSSPSSNAVEVRTSVELEEMRDTSIHQISEVAELRGEIEELQLLVNHRRHQEIPGYPACGFDGCNISTDGAR
jgi:hypothetical protein